jgi:hypothetical protein
VQVNINICLSNGQIMHTLGYVYGLMFEIHVLTFFLPTSYNVNQYQLCVKFSLVFYLWINMIEVKIFVNFYLFIWFEFNFRACQMVLFYFQGCIPTFSCIFFKLIIIINTTWVLNHKFKVMGSCSRFCVFTTFITHIPLCIHFISLISRTMKWSKGD